MWCVRREGGALGSTCERGREGGQVGKVDARCVRGKEVGRDVIRGTCKEACGKRGARATHGAWLVTRQSAASCWLEALLVWLHG